MQTYSISPAFTVHYPELIKVWEKSVRATHYFLEEADIQHYQSLILRTYFDKVQLFYIKNEDKILGFIGISGQMIQMLFVDCLAFGKGVGTALLNFAVEHYQANSVDVNEQNTQAVGFYEHFGFIKKVRYSHDAAGKPYPIVSMILKKDRHAI